MTIKTDCCLLFVIFHFCILYIPFHSKFELQLFSFTSHINLSKSLGKLFIFSFHSFFLIYTHKARVNYRYLILKIYTNWYLQINSFNSNHSFNRSLSNNFWYNFPLFLIHIYIYIHSLYHFIFLFELNITRSITNNFNFFDPFHLKSNLLQNIKN